MLDDIRIEFDSKAVENAIALAIAQQDPEMHAALLEIGHDVANRAKQLAPKAAVHRSKGMTLAESIKPRVNKNMVVVRASKRYAKIQHWGGRVGPHEIVPKKKQALSFNGITVKKVNHPGGSIRGTMFLWKAKDEMEARITQDVDHAVQRSLRSLK